MKRDLDAQVVAILGGSVFTPGILLYLDFESAPIYIWTGTFPLVYDGQTYLGLGDLIAIDKVQETGSLEAKGITVSLDAVKGDYIYAALAERYRGREAKMSLVFLDQNNVIGQGILLFEGIMDTMSVTLGANAATISMKIENRMLQMNNKDIQRYTDQYQQYLFPGDLGLEYVAGLAEKQIKWGRA